MSVGEAQATAGPPASSRGEGRARRWLVEYGPSALLIVVGILYAFYKDSHFEREYKPNIIYVKSWPLNRSDEEIAAQAKIDNAERDKQRAALAKKQKERQEGFQKLDNSLKEWGF